MLVNGDDRITVVRRREGNVRLVFDSVKRSLLLLTDFSSPSANTPDGVVDWVYSFTDVAGDWPLAARWDGAAVIDEYWVVDGGRRAIVISTSAGAIELATPMVRDDIIHLDGTPPFRLSFRSSRTSQGANGSFDESERRANDSGVQGGVQGGMRETSAGVVTDAPVAAISSPLRVGGNVRQPTKLFDVQPTYPQKARDAGIAGTVVVELTIGTDGAVTDARVLRSIPLLDDAALQAVRQWRYEVTLLNGVPVPVRIIVSVPFGT